MKKTIVSLACAITLSAGLAACSSAPSDGGAATPDVSNSSASSAPSGDGLPSPVEDDSAVYGAAIPEAWAYASQGDALVFLVTERASSPELRALAENMGLEYKDVMNAVVKLYQGDGLTPPRTIEFQKDIRGGMVPLERMTELANTTGEGFDRLWLESMIGQHEAFIQAVEPALTSDNPKVRELAERVVASQTAQLEQMRALLATLP